VIKTRRNRSKIRMMAMKLKFPKMVHSAQQQAATEGLDIKRTHFYELCAALLGYGSYAAYKLEAEILVEQLSKAEYVVLQYEFASRRAAMFGLPRRVSARVIAIGLNVLFHELGSTLPQSASVQESVTWFVDSAMCEALQGFATESVLAARVSPTLAGSECDIENIMYPSDICTSGDDWVVSADAKVYLGIHESGYAKERVDASASITYRKIARIGLIRKAGNLMVTDAR
jgi:hypothetical protein